jgi:hypothetical protein
MKNQLLLTSLSGKSDICDDNGVGDEMVPVEGIEPPTFGLQNRCSTAELNRQSLLLIMSFAMK